MQLGFTSLSCVMAIVLMVASRFVVASPVPDDLPDGELQGTSLGEPKIGDPGLELECEYYRATFNNVIRHTYPLI